MRDADSLGRDDLARLPDYLNLGDSPLASLSRAVPTRGRRIKPQTTAE